MGQTLEGRVDAVVKGMEGLVYQAAYRAAWKAAAEQVLQQTVYLAQAKAVAMGLCEVEELMELKVQVA